MTNSTNLTAGQRAALTRAANKANGSGTPSGKSKPAAPASVIGEGRLSGLTLTLQIHATAPDRLTLSFLPTREQTGEAYATGLGTGERGLPDLVWAGVLRDNGDWEPSASSATLTMRGGDYLADLARLMAQADTALVRAREESEDPTFAFVVQQLATMFRVTSVSVRSASGETTIHKRGTAYLTTLRLCDTMAAAIAKAPKPAPAQPSKPAPAPVPAATSNAAKAA